MTYCIGIDLGTSGVKTMLLSESGIEKITSKNYTVKYFMDCRSEQDPNLWVVKTTEALKELLNGVDKSKVASISFSGQMHGLVMLDKNNEIIRDAILWNDGRSIKEVEYLNSNKMRSTLLESTGNIAFAGFTAPKLMWVKENEPDNFKRIAKICLPKDYLQFCFSGKFCTDVSDASGTLYFDVKNRKWSDKMLEIIGINESMLPEVLESDGFTGTITKEYSELLGIPENVKIFIGAGDNAASAIGTGTVNNGDCNISLGTSGTIFVVNDKFICDKENAIHSFCSASHSYHLMACILSAASCQKWWIENIINAGYDDVNSMKNRLGTNKVLFLPYLSGERSPVNDTEARALFYGMSMSTAKNEMTLAVIEGVAFALRQNLEIIRNLGIDVKKSKVCGGAIKNDIWASIIADVLNIEIEIPAVQEGAALGAALIAAKGVLSSDEYEELSKKLCKTERTIKPDEDITHLYDIQYSKYLKLYPAALTLE